MTGDGEWPRLDDQMMNFNLGNNYTNLTNMIGLKNLECGPFF